MQLSGTSFGHARFMIERPFMWHVILIVGRRRRVILVLKTSMFLTRRCWKSLPGT